MEQMSQKEMEPALVKSLKDWQLLEDETVRVANEVMSRSCNSLVRMITDIIAHDSVMHRRVQQFIIDSIEKEPISVTPGDLEAIWDLIEKHNEKEKKTIDLADKAKGCARLFPERFLLNYLMEDERKHDSLLERLEEIRLRMYP